MVLIFQYYTSPLWIYSQWNNKTKDTGVNSNSRGFQIWYYCLSLNNKDKVKYIMVRGISMGVSIYIYIHIYLRKGENFLLF